MKKTAITFLLLLSSSHAIAGGPIETNVFTGDLSNGNPTLELLETSWDPRCSKIQFIVDSSVNPNDINGNPIAIEQWLPELEAAAKTWSDLPASFIEIEIIDTAILETADPDADPLADSIGDSGLFGDHMNTLTFNNASFGTVSPDVIAFSAPTLLLEDTIYIANTDLDGDGDIDVFEPADGEEFSCTDIDGDGDIEFVAGAYKAGTIIENDIIFLDERWETVPAGPEPTTFAIASDIQQIALHEMGHSIGLDHSALSDVSEITPRNPVMFPFAPSASAQAEFINRTPWDDDAAWASFLYPEGSDSKGPAALQSGDISFNSIYSILRGSVKQGRSGVIAASVQAIDVATGERRFEAFSGETGIFTLDPITFAPTFFSRRTAIIDGDFEIPVDRNSDYQVLIEPLDGPVFPSSIGPFGQIGEAFGQNTFPTESWSAAPRDRSFETAPGRFDVVNGVTKEKIDFQLNNVSTLSNTLNGASPNIPFDLLGQDQIVYAERFRNKEILKEISRGNILTTARFETFPLGDSIVQEFAEVSLVLGFVNSNDEVEIVETLRRSRNFTVQSQDFTPFFLRRSRQLTNELKYKLGKNKRLDVFVIAESKPMDFSDPDTLSPILIFDATGNVDPATSFSSSAGGSLTSRTISNWSINLHFAEARR